MKTITIEQVDNGYIVTNKPESRGDSVVMLVGDDTGIHVFETFASMSNWLHGHFEPEDKQSSKGGAMPSDFPTMAHLGTDEV